MKRRLIGLITRNDMKINFIGIIQTLFLGLALAPAVFCQNQVSVLPPAMTEKTGMTNIGRLLLPEGVPAQYSAAFDSTTGFGYFGATSHIDPVIVSKVNLNGPLPTNVQDGQPNSVPKGVVTLLTMGIDTSE